MKQAILLMLHKDIEQAKDLILYFQGKCDIFIHIDKSCKINEKELETIKSLPGVINVYQKYTAMYSYIFTF